MTSLAAAHLRLAGRGRLAPAYAADPVLSGSETLGDRATPEGPHALSAGSDRVFVAGESVFEHGGVTAARPDGFRAR